MISPPTQLAPLNAPDAAPVANLAVSDNHFLTFTLGEVFYAVPADRVREIHWLPELSPLDEAGPAIVGLLNLRGQVLPVMDLSERLGHMAAAYRVEDSVIIVEHRGQLAGLIVHLVQSVVSISPRDIEPVPQFGRASQGHSGFVRSIAKIDGRMIMLLDLDQLFDASSQAPVDFGASEGHDSADHQLLVNPARRFEPYASDEDRAIFRERAERLLAPIETQDTRGLFPMALVAIGGEQFGIHLSEVREFSNPRNVTPVPCCPPHILGQMNLRGDVVTLVDVQPLLHLPPRGEVTTGKILVIQHENAPIGVPLDEVLDVLYLSPEQITPLQASSHSVSHQYFNGGAFHQGRMICLLNLPRLIADGSLIVDETP